MVRHRSLTIAAIGPAAVVAAAVFYVAYDDGGYALTTRSTIAIAIWWAILVGVGLRVWPLERVPTGAVVTGSLLAAFAAWDLASTAWAASAENAYAEFDRTALYLGVYILAVVATDGRQRAHLVDGLTAAIVAVGVVSLIGRLFPGSFPSRGVPTFLPSASTRLSFPLDYWNGLGIFVALVFPLLLHWVLAGSRVRRVTAVATLPALGSVVYLTSSRGAVVALAAGVLLFVVAQPRRFAALGAVAVGAGGTAVAIAMLASRHALVDGPLTSAAARTEGREAALAIVLICAATAVVSESAAAFVPRLELSARDRRRLRATASVVVVLAAVFGIYRTALAFQDFTRLPAGDAGAGHLLSGSGSGRWQFWAAALHEFEDSPLYGHGAGSYEAWWLQHGSFRYFVGNAHSLYLQTLGELGIVGFLLLAGALAAGVTVGVRRLLRSRGVERGLSAGLLGTLTAYLIGAGIDWMWELTAVTIVGVFALGLLGRPATPTRSPPPAAARQAGGWVVPVLAAVVACSIVVAEAIPLLADVEVRRSQADVRAGSLQRAWSRAVDATRIEPWAASPYLQLALVEEAGGDLASARRAIDASIRRDREDWRTWLIAARIERRLGDTAAAARSLARARALNPRSPLVSRHT
jgi:hypothetical protein